MQYRNLSRLRLRYAIWKDCGTENKEQDEGVSTRFAMNYIKGNAMTILIIEDDAGISELLKEKLEESGHETAGVQSAGEAMTWLETHSPFLMVLDYGLPDMNGKELIEVLKQKERPLPDFIVSTGQGDERIAVDMMKLGARDYIVKDANFLDMLPEVVRRVEQEIENENKLKRAEEDLLESEIKFHAIFEHSRDAIGVSKNGINILVNKAYLDMFGYDSKEELVNTSILNLITPNERSRIIENMQKRVAGKAPEIYETLGLRKDGSEFEMEVSVSTYTLNREMFTLVTLRDITERKLAEESLQQSEAQKQAILDGITSNIAFVNKNLEILWANKTAAESVNKTPEEMLGFKCHAFWADPNKPCENCPSIKAFQTSKSEQTIMYSPGGSVWEERGEPVFDSKGELLGVVEIAQDITERKRAEEALRKSERRHRIIFENSPLGMIRFDSEGTMVDFNDKFIELMGSSREKLIGFNTARQSTPEMRRAIKKALAGQVAVFENEYTSITAGKTRYLHVVFNPVNPGNSPTQVIATLEDITERRQAEEEKEKLEAQNRLLQKTESLGRMAGAIAHNFNNLFQAVTGNLEMAMEDLPRDARYLKNLAAAMRAANQAADMSGLMLTYIGQSSANREPVDIADACRQSLSGLRAAMPKEINLEAVFPASGPVVNANTAQLQQILTHLATNAWEAANQDRGSIDLSVGTVSAADIPDSDRFPPDWQPQDNAHAYLKVADKGRGIKHEDIDKIFDPFFTDKFTGRGLGLAVVLGIVKALDGGITVASEPNRGSVFRIFLPLSSQSVTRPVDSAKMPGIEDGGLILVADDQEGVRNVAEAMLEQIGFQAITAKDGVEAVEIFRKKQADISLVISDLSMPRMNGWETLTALRRIRPDIPVILSSGYDEAQAMNGKHSEQPQAFLAKPYRMKNLKDALANVLAKGVT